MIRKVQLANKLTPYLVGSVKLYRLSYRIFEHMHEVLNIDYL